MRQSSAAHDVNFCYSFSLATSRVCILSAETGTKSREFVRSLVRWFMRHNANRSIFRDLQSPAIIYDGPSVKQITCGPATYEASAEMSGSGPR
jgi:hypothetical protein